MRSAFRSALHVVRRPWPFFAICLVVTFLNFAVWSLANPLFSAPDEPTHVVRAAAIVRGQFVGSTIGSARNAETGVTIPDVFLATPSVTACFAFHPSVPASCAPHLNSSTAPVLSSTYVGRYPPLYYLMVGIPTLFVKSTTGPYLMRLASALVSAVLVSLALLSVALWSRRRLLFVGVLAACTPMVWFLGGVINPSGFEVSAAVCLWTSGLILFTERSKDPPPGLVAVVAASACAFTLARPLSLLWLAITFVCLILAGGWRTFPGLLARRSVRWACVPLGACAAFALWWVLAQHALDLLPVGRRLVSTATSLQVLSSIIREVPSWGHQMIGVFGVLDSPSPAPTYVLWLVVVAAACIVALARGRARERVSLVVAILCVLGLPVVIAFSQYHRLGVVWQGRDILPLAVGIPILAVGAAHGETGFGRWQVPVAMGSCAALGVAYAAAFLDDLRRYTVGLGGPIDFLHGPWHPPLGTLPIAIAGLLVEGVVLVAAAIASAGPPGCTLVSDLAPVSGTANAGLSGILEAKTTSSASGSPGLR